MICDMEGRLGRECERAKALAGVLRGRPMAVNSRVGDLMGRAGAFSGDV
jgi:hypothetical protein